MSLLPPPDTVHWTVPQMLTIAVLSGGSWTLLVWTASCVHQALS